MMGAVGHEATMCFTDSFELMQWKADCSASRRRDGDANKRKVWIYPEGTRNPGKTMLPFKKGAFILSIEAKIPVVCCVFSSHSFFYDAAEKKLDSGECLVEFLPPVDPSSFNSVDDLSNHCRNLMMLKHEELNEELRDKLSKKQN
ncbi:1-acyl-sn-glycerol-3-phosphate acyltransferase domain protein [Ancylostoma ceylanicum]|uniref:1-acylglycerol-3-phosphate O-acyltransferase n=1 Tax=Ancylostoma ceylanicum TaxID=53326 RepID=A0A0D6M5H8_9BILA|nr:1-acyl-sn-glycerol-3-phosphate acyltransferase domain protein [Ancylostoma ceylanicum]